MLKKKKKNFDNFDSTLYSTSVSMPLIMKYKFNILHVYYLRQKQGKAYMVYKFSTWWAQVVAITSAHNVGVQCPNLDSDCPYMVFAWCHMVVCIVQTRSKISCEEINRIWLYLDIQPVTLYRVLTLWVKPLWLL